MSHRIRVLSAVAGSVLLVALVVAGCGGRAVSPSPVATEGVTAVAPSAAAGIPSASPAESVVPPAATATATTAPLATKPPTPAPTPPPTASPAPPAPFEAPDLTEIQRLLDELDAALGADATADTDEGSAP